MAPKQTASKIGRFDRRLVIALAVGVAIVAGLWWFPVRSQIAAHDEFRDERDMLEQRISQTRADIAAVESGAGADVENLWQIAAEADQLFPTDVSESEMILFIPDQMRAAGLTEGDITRLTAGDSSHGTLSYFYVDANATGDVDRILAFIERMQGLRGDKFVTVHDVSITDMGADEARVSMQLRFWYTTLASVSASAADTDAGSTAATPETTTTTAVVPVGDDAETDTGADELGPGSSPVEVLDAATDAVGG